MPTELVEAGLHAADEVAEEADRVVQDRADDAGGAGQHVEQHVLESEDGLDDADSRVIDPLPELLFSSRSFCSIAETRCCDSLNFWTRLLTSLSRRSSISPVICFEVAGNCCARLAAEFGDALVEPGNELIDVGLSARDAALGLGELAFHVVRDEVDRARDLVVVGGLRRREGMLDELFPIVTPCGQPGANSALLLIEDARVGLLGAAEAFVEHLAGGSSPCRRG